MNITYVGPVFDSSGYAEACRNNIAALHKVGITLNVKPISFEANKTDMGELGTLCESLIGKNPQGKIQIIHCTPENYPNFISKDVYNIGYVAWETSRLPSGWAELINQLSEVWVPSDYNVEVFRNSGVTIPIRKIPHAFNTQKKVVGESLIQRTNDKEYVFYSIFQWLERKNPTGLLKAYLTEFKKEENVILVIKTFISNHSSQSEISRIKAAISDMKARLYLSSYPRILLLTDLLTADQVMSLHQGGDCFVHLARSEGFGIPIVEAQLVGKPVIASDYSGMKELVNWEARTGCPVKCIETPVHGMPWSIYSGDMVWAEPNLMDARKAMRYVFTHQDEARLIGGIGKKVAEDSFSWTTIGNIMKKRLEEINGR